MSRKIKLTGIFLVSFISFCFSQETGNKNHHYFEPEYLIGKIIPISNNSKFPETSFQQTIALSMGFTNNDTTKWGRYYNHAETGFMTLYSYLGNGKVLGHQFSLLPFISFKIFNHLKTPCKLRLGAGISYFTSRFDSLSNPTNEVIGSQFTWDVKVFMYKSILKKNGFNLQVGFGFSHESNGHTRLPNLGINSPMLTISGKFYNYKEDNYVSSTRVKRGNIAPKNYFFTIRQGLGLHEQDETEGPQMGVLKPVYATTVSSSILFNNHLKLRAGFTYRLYRHYYDHIIENQVDGLIDNPGWSASNVSFFLGNEFLMSHVSIDGELGVNLHKPFYRKFNPKSDVGLTLQKTLLTRIGLNLYLINTQKMPKHNLFIGTHIKANMVKADYTEFTLGYTYKLN